MNTENDIITAIFKGEQQEKYAEWAKHKMLKLDMH